VCAGRLTPVAWVTFSVTFLCVFHCRWAVLLPQKVCNTQNEFPPEFIVVYVCVSIQGILEFACLWHTKGPTHLLGPSANFSTNNFPKRKRDSTRMWKDFSHFPLEMVLLYIWLCVPAWALLKQISRLCALEKFVCVRFWLTL